VLLSCSVVAIYIYMIYLALRVPSVNPKAEIAQLFRRTPPVGAPSMLGCMTFHSKIRPLLQLSNLQLVDRLLSAKSEAEVSLIWQACLRKGLKVSDLIIPDPAPEAVRSFPLRIGFVYIAFQVSLKIVFSALGLKNRFPLDIICSSVLTYFVWQYNCLDFVASASSLFIETVASGWSQVVRVLCYCLDLGYVVLHLVPLDTLILLGLVTLSFKLIIRLLFRRSGFSLPFWLSFALTCIFWYLGCIPPLHSSNLAVWRDWLEHGSDQFLWVVFCLTASCLLLVATIILLLGLEELFYYCFPEFDQSEGSEEEAECPQERPLALKDLTGDRLSRFMSSLENKRARELVSLFAMLAGLDISAFGDLQDPKVFKRCVRNLSFYFHSDKTRSLEMSSDERCAREEIMKVIVDLKENGPEYRWTRIS